MPARYGNILGDARAEKDASMLDQAFLKTPDFVALTKTQDFHFVVGRRGAGKSALYRQVCNYLKEEPKTWVYAEGVEEHYSMAIQSILTNKQGDYRTVRSVMRLIWLSYGLISAARQCIEHYKADRSSHFEWLRTYLDEHPDWRDAISGSSYAYTLIRNYPDVAIMEIPSRIAQLTQINRLQDAVRSVLTSSGTRAVLLFDKIDEGWVPTGISTALVGGLALVPLLRSSSGVVCRPGRRGQGATMELGGRQRRRSNAAIAVLAEQTPTNFGAAALAASDLADAEVPVHKIVFIRDNIFRALADYDADFTRHVEGVTLRVSWDEESLFRMISQRIRVALSLKIENNKKVWDRFAKRGLKDSIGFSDCLKSTLYRPRDVISLLNRAYRVARGENRDVIIESDVEKSAKEISSERLSDLLKEYNIVLPGLRLFVQVFAEQVAVGMLFKKVIALLDETIDSQTYEEPETSDFALLESGREIFHALYSVGFIGIEDTSTGKYRFCHDGAPFSLDSLPPDTRTAIHPCYWRALSINDTHDAVSIDLVSDVHDEYQHVKTDAPKDNRIRRLGQIVEELPRLEAGHASASSFEDWVLRATRILFAGDLSNFELHPNKDATQRRDIVATNVATSGFWRRVYEDYNSRQVVFEVKNYADLKPDDFRQAFSYSGDEYGRISFLVYRAVEEGAKQSDRSQIQEYYHRHNHLIILLPAFLLSRYLSKQRSARREDYWREKLQRRVDTHLRSYISIGGKSNTKNRNRRKKKKKPS